MNNDIDYYKAIKQELEDNEIYKKVKDYSKNKYELKKYCNVGKLLIEAGNKYGEKVIKEYSKKLMVDLGKKYSVRYLFDIRKLYLFSKVHPLGALLSMSHYRILFRLKNMEELNYYEQQCINRNLSKRNLEEIIKNHEYERLPVNTKMKLIMKEETNLIDYIKNPLIIKNNKEYNHFTEKVLKNLIIENLSSFLKELGEGFSYIDNEYKIKIGNQYNYIDLLLYNIKYRCYVVIELKVTELKKEHVGQIQVYMNYINENVKSLEDNDTIGIIICKEDNQYIIRFCSDNRIITRTYLLI